MRAIYQRVVTVKNRPDFRWQIDCKERSFDVA